MWKTDNRGNTSLQAGRLTLEVVRKHIYNPDNWTLHCHAVGIHCYDLRVSNEFPIEVAQETAYQFIETLLVNHLANLKEAVKPA